MTPNHAIRSLAQAVAALTITLAVALVPSSAATSVTTAPEGYFTLNIAEGTGTTQALTLLSAPLYETAAAAGQTSGRLTGVTASTLSNDAAGWTGGQLSAAASPYALRITSGAAKGRTFLLSTGAANTSTTVTLDASESATDLTTLGIATGANGDTYELLACDTLLSLLGTPATTGVLGNSNSGLADTVQLLVGVAYIRYYHDGTNWRRIGPNTVSNNVAIPPDKGVIYARLAASPMTLVMTGRVPNVARQAAIANSGITLLANGFPANATLGSSGINAIPGWVSSTSSGTADVVQILVGVAYIQYYHDGTNWRRIGPNTISNNQLLAEGSAVILSKRGTATGLSLLSQNLPYTF